MNIKAAIYLHEFKQWLAEGTDFAVKVAFTNVNIN